jgi:hypothetical protein
MKSRGVVLQIHYNVAAVNKCLRKRHFKFLQLIILFCQSYFDTVRDKQKNSERLSYELQNHAFEPVSTTTRRAWIFTENKNHMMQWSAALMLDSFRRELKRLQSKYFVLMMIYSLSYGIRIQTRC